MGVNHTLFRNNENFKGLDLRSSDIRRSAEYSSDMRNAAYRSTGAINKRKGFKISAQNPDSSYGVATFRKTNKDTGTIEDEFISINGNAHKLIDKYLTLEYEGASDIWYSLYLKEDSSSFGFQIKEQDTVLLDLGLGSGFNNSDMTISQLAYYIQDLKFPIATAIPGDLNYLLHLGSTSQAPGGLPTQENEEYTLHLLPKYVTNSAALFIGQYIKLGTESSYLEITNIEKHQVSGETILYTLTLYGVTSYIDSEGTVSETVPVYQYHDITASYDPSISAHKAALLDNGLNVPIESASVGGTKLSAKLWEQIPNGDPSITESFDWKTLQNTSALLDKEVENATFASLHNSLYISNGYDYIHKYDGKYVYRAGLPVPDTSLFTFFTEDASASSPTFDDYYYSSGTNFQTGLRQYKIVYEYTDALGNIISSQPSEAISKEVNTNEVLTVKWNVNSFKESLKGRDLQGIFDTDHSSYQFLSDLPTIQGTSYRPFNKNNSLINTYADSKKYRNEKRLRIKIYRTTTYNPANGEVAGQFYLIADLPYDQPDLKRLQNDTLTLGVMTDAGTIDDLLNDELNVFTALVDPIKRHDPPPKGKYITVYKNCLVVAGQLQNVNNVQYSLPKNASTGEIGCEYFPEDSNGLIINSKFGDKITAIAPLRDLMYIFHNDSIHIMGGQINLLEDPIIDLLTKEGGVGCTSHNSIEEFRNQLLFLSSSGIYTIDASNSLQELSSPINSLFNDKDLQFKRAATFNWTDENLLVTMIPKEDYAYIPETVTEIVKHPAMTSMPFNQFVDGTYIIYGTSNFQINPTSFGLASSGTNGIKGSGLVLKVTISNSQDVDIEILEPGTGYVPGDVLRIDASELGASTNALYLKITATDRLLNTIYTSPYEESLIVAYDYFRNAWLRWDSLDFTGGVSIYRDRVTFATRGENISYLCSMNTTGGKYDYADHIEPINFYYETNWESLGDPTIPKKFLRIKLYSLDTDETFENSTFELVTSYYRDYLPANIAEITFNFGENALGWGESPWGMFAWGNPAVNIQKHKLPTTKSKSLKVRFTNTQTNTNILLTNYEFEIAAPYQTEIKD